MGGSGLRLCGTYHPKIPPFSLRPLTLYYYLIYLPFKLLLKHLPPWPSLSTNPWCVQPPPCRKDWYCLNRRPYWRAGWFIEPIMISHLYFTFSPLAFNIYYWRNYACDKLFHIRLLRSWISVVLFVSKVK